jgi:hypothetical protein
VKRSGPKGKSISELPIRERWGPTPLGVFEKAPGVAAEILEEAPGILEKNLLSQTDFLLQRSKSDRPAT